MTPRRDIDDEREGFQIPKSTIIVGSAFWTVLFGMTTWLLLGVVSLKETVVRIDGKLDGVAGMSRWNSQRLDGLEQRQRVTEAEASGFKYQLDALRERSR